MLPYKEKKLSIKTSKDGRKYVKIKCPKRWDNNDNTTKNLGYKSANLIDEASLEFTGVKCSHLMFDLKKPKEEIWFHRNKKYRMGSSLYEQFRFKGKNKYYTLLCSDSENPNGQTYTIIESKKQ